MEYNLFALPSFDDKNSSLVVLESLKNIPFEIKRIFYIFDVPANQSRGEHANLKSKFFFIALRGVCKIEIDKKEIIVLDKPNEGLFLDSMLWKKMYDFSQDCILLVLSDSFYNKDEYIYEYENYVAMKRGEGGGGDK